MYTAIVSVTIVSLVVGPLLQASRLIDFSARQAQAASARPVTEALGLATAGADQGSLLPVVAGPLAATTSGATVQRITAGGDGSDSVDSDTDGLSDRVENCLGTDPFNPDTDGDGLNDGVEVTGFSFGGQTWYSDALRLDANGDGRGDLEAWPASQGGRAAVIDQEVERRFTSPNTPLDHRWGLPTTTSVAVSRTVYTHHDEGVARARRAWSRR